MSKELGSQNDTLILGDQLREIAESGADEYHLGV